MPRAITRTRPKCALVSSHSRVPIVAHTTSVVLSSVSTTAARDHGAAGPGRAGAAGRVEISAASTRLAPEAASEAATKSGHSRVMEAGRA
jgi:hypothetical protein